MTAPTISASAIESFDAAQGGCARKWAFSRLDGVPKPQSPGAALGSRCHELWENYLRDGTPFDLSTVEGRICDATRHLLPAPGTCMAVEEAFRFDWEGVTWAGKKDVEYWDETAGVDVVLDHKTTSDFRYAKSERSSLLEHPQAPLYAVEMLTRGNDVRTALAWNYVRHGVTFDKDAPTGPYGYTIKRAGRPVTLEPPVRLIVERAEAEDALGKFVPTAKRMLKIIAEPPAPIDGSIARALEPNPDACDAFGGCPYRAQCGLTPQEIASRITRSFATVEKEQAMGLRDRIAAIKAERGGPTQSSAIGVQQAIEAEAAAKVAREVNAEMLRAAKIRADEATANLAAAQSVFGPVNPPEGVMATRSVDAQPLPPAEAPTQPDAPRAKRRGRPPGSRNKVKEALDTPLPDGAEGMTPSEAVAAVIAVDELLNPEDETSDTIPAPAIDVEEVAQRAAEIVFERLRGAL